MLLIRPDFFSVGLVINLQFLFFMNIHKTELFRLTYAALGFWVLLRHRNSTHLLCSFSLKLKHSGEFIASKCCTYCILADGKHSKVDKSLFCAANFIHKIQPPAINPSIVAMMCAPRMSFHTDDVRIYNWPLNTVAVSVPELLFRDLTIRKVKASIPMTHGRRWGNIYVCQCQLCVHQMQTTFAIKFTNNSIRYCFIGR